MRSSVIAGLSVAASVMALAACATGTSPAASVKNGCTNTNLTTVRVSEVIHSVFYAPQYVADSKGFFCQEGITLDTDTSQGSDKGTAALLSNSADVALVGPETTVFIQNNKQSSTKVKVFAQATATDGSFLVGHTAQPNFSWEDVRGKTIIGWRPGSEPEMVLEYVLEQHGLTPGKDVTVKTNIAAPAMAGAFLSKQGDYVTLFQPTVAALAGKGGFMIRPLAQDVGELPETVYVATNAYIASHKALIQKFTDAVAKAETWLQTASPEEIEQAVAPAFDTTDKQQLVASAKAYQEAHGWPKSPLMTEQGFAKLEQIMVAGGVLEKKDFVRYDDVVDPTFAGNVKVGD
jgi:NitT/TauT family transport system substrate-binding protein